MTGDRGCAVTPASPGGGPGRLRGSRRGKRCDAGRRDSWPALRLKLRSDTPPRVQAVPESVKIHQFAWARRDLNPHTRAFSPISCLSTQVGEKSPSWGFHAFMVAGTCQLASSRLRRLVRTRVAGKLEAAPYRGKLRRQGQRQFTVCSTAPAQWPRLTDRTEDHVLRVWAASPLLSQV